MSSKSVNPSKRTILTAARKLKPSKSDSKSVVSTSTSCVSSKHAVERSSGTSSSSKSKSYSREKGLSNIDQKKSKSIACTKEKSKITNTTSVGESSSSKKLREELVKQIMVGSANLSKSFKIPKKSKDEAVDNNVKVEKMKNFDEVKKEPIKVKKDGGGININSSVSLPSSSLTNKPSFSRNFKAIDCRQYNFPSIPIPTTSRGRCDENFSRISNSFSSPGGSDGESNVSLPSSSLTNKPSFSPNLNAVDSRKYTFPSIPIPTTPRGRGDENFSKISNSFSSPGGSDGEDMEWETTVQEIKNLWHGSCFSPNLGSQRSSVSDRDDIEMEVDSDANVELQLIIVPDTNVWIHSLSLIRELLDSKFPNYGYPVIVIPWMVLQELDVSGKNPGGPSRSAIHYIHKLLRSNHPRVKGQKASDAAVIHSDFDRRNADDSILQCVQQQQKTNSFSTKVVLLTSDINMTNKAIVNKMLTADTCYGTRGIIDVLKTDSSNDFSCPENLVSSLPFKSHEAAKVPVFTSTAVKQSIEEITARSNSKSDTDQSRRPPSPQKRRKRSPSPMKLMEKKKPKDVVGSKFSAQPFSEILSLIKETLSHVIEIKMKEDYGDPGWLKALKIPPPWTLKSAVQCIIKHWMAVFSEVFGRRVGVAEKLLTCINAYGEISGGSQNIEREKEIVEHVLGLFAAGEFSMSDIVREDSQVNLCRKTLLEFIKRTGGNTN